MSYVCGSQGVKVNESHSPVFGFFSIITFYTFLLSTETGQGLQINGGFLVILHLID